MVKIRPFRGYRYNGEKVDIGKAIFPPYELASRQFRNIFLEMSGCNVIRIMLGSERLGKAGRYKHSARLLSSWIRKGYLKRDGSPCIYVYSQEFKINGNKKERTGFISLVELEKLGRNIVPHELTFHDQIVDMGAILKSTRANLGPVFSIYSDPAKSIESMLEKIKRERKPEMEAFTGYEGVRHRVWAVKDGKIINHIAHEMKNKKLLIADGHHRYNISFEYSRKHPDDEKAKYISMMMVNMENEGVVILPTHRLVKGIKNFSREKFTSSLERNFEIKAIEFMGKNGKEKLKGLLRKISIMDWRNFGMYLGGRKFYILKLKNESAMNVAKNHSKSWKRFAVNVLHKLVIEGILGIGTSKIDGHHNVEYVKDIRRNAETCVKRVKNGECQIAFFMSPAKMEDVREICRSGEVMPQKSTCFYPKVYSGVVIYKFENGERNF
jgi:uncharacterized protein (DUF1015 family)